MYIEMAEVDVSIDEKRGTEDQAYQEDDPVGRKDSQKEGKHDCLPFCISKQSMVLYSTGNAAYDSETSYTKLTRHVPTSPELLNSRQLELNGK